VGTILPYLPKHREIVSPMVFHLISITLEQLLQGGGSKTAKKGYQTYVWQSIKIVLFLTNKSFQKKSMYKIEIYFKLS